MRMCPLFSLEFGRSLTCFFLADVDMQSTWYAPLPKQPQEGLTGLGAAIDQPDEEVSWIP